MGRVPGDVAVRAPHLYPLLRGFVLGSFVVLGRELEEGAELPFAFEEHVERRGPSLYELRPLVRTFIEEREPVLRAREDARLAVEELRREPAAAIFARAHAGPRASEDEALFRTVLLGLLIGTAEACGGFDWDDEAFERSYAELEASLFGERRRYVAIAPLIGLSLAKPVELAEGLLLRPFVTGELATHWPESRGLLPREFGRVPDRLGRRRAPARARCRRSASGRGCRDRGCRERAAAHDHGSRRGRAGDVRDPRRTAVRDPARACRSQRRSPRVSRRGSTRFGRRSPSTSSPRSATPTAIPSSPRHSIAGSCRSSSPSRFGASRFAVALASLLGETWPMRGCVLLAEDAAAREELYGELTALSGGDAATAATTDAARRAVVAVLRSHDRDRLAHDLDRELLGLDRRQAPRAIAV